MRFETERLILREIEESDFEAIHSYASVPENVKFMAWGPNDEDGTREFIKTCIERTKENPRIQYDFAVILKESGKLIGSCGIYLKDNNRQGDLGYILHRDYWKQGFMLEAMQSVVEFGFNTLKLLKIDCFCFAENYGSKRIMEKLGMKYEGEFDWNNTGRIALRYSLINNR